MNGIFIAMLIENSCQTQCHNRKMVVYMAYKATDSCQDMGISSYMKTYQIEAWNLSSHKYNWSI